MFIGYNKYLSVVFLPFVFEVTAEDYQDPFEEGIELSVEHEADEAKSSFAWDLDISLLGYHQVNDVRKALYFDPGNFIFEDRESQLALDFSGQFSLGSYFSVHSRIASIEQYLINEAGDSDREWETYVLEGYFSSCTANKRIGINIGRIKPQWSNGYNWSPANLLEAVYDRPNLDTDNLTQQHGWDMVHLDFRYGDWNTGIYVAQVEENLGQGIANSTREDELQYALVINREGNLDSRLVLHHLENGATNVAVGFSSLAGDSATLRLEAAWERQRELPALAELTYLQPEDDGYLKLVVGTQVSFDHGWDLTAEYLYNQHGYDGDEWPRVQVQVDSAKANINSEQVHKAFTFLSDSFNFLSVGQLRQEYLFFMWGNTRFEQKFQYRQSLQYNISDKSQYHNLELIQNWTEHFSTRLQAQVFRGCDSCEFGLLPTEKLLRLSFYYDF
ncbi:hypothetical protein MO867_10460 [Microbulbifer sp. OS29]|uniref:Uncharacterized protein n=1 Tax=Microbulbifer okhotskensis TaxID=2926617 RepID=A0A9X2ES64_9GAMM|nr:hypothetical protein [Microbulbifer okhotskensis]MCO1334761.1 hypothetical protein [Microbulbifer okhotskensis]